jgi:hypothetical protein
MALPVNDDFANRELSIEELEAIAAGNFLGSALSWVKKEVKAGIKYIEHNETAHKVFAGAVGYAAGIGAVALLDFLTA